MKDLRLFIPITKVDAAQRLVYGIATAEQEDRSGEICDYESTKPYYEKWSADIAKTTDGRSLGNVRAMHSSVAAGKVTQLVFNDDAKQIEICAKVVDDAEWRKVEEGVYTGFSQGGKYVKRWKDDAGLQRYTAEPSEVSLVDLPCLPTATFEVIKADGLIETRKFKMPGPVTNADIVKKAEDLAKAAGSSDWTQFIGAARAELEKASIVATSGSPREGFIGGEARDQGHTDKHPRPRVEVEDGTDGQDGFTGDAAAGDGEPKWTVDSTDEAGVKSPQTKHSTKAEAEDEAAQRKRIGHTDVKIGAAKAVAGDLAKVVQVWLPESSLSLLEKGVAFLRKADALAVAATAATTGPVLDRLAEIGGKLGLEKREFSEEDRKKAADAGEALPDGSFPIKTKDDLANAVQAYGRAKDKPKAALALMHKGLPTVARLACLIEDLTWVKGAVHMETRQENDDSKVPAMLLQNLSDLCDTLNAMCAEETAELVAGQNVDDLNNVPNVFNMAAGIPAAHLAALTKFAVGRPELVKIAEILGKRGARNSKADLEKIQAMHDHACDLGAKCDKANCDDGMDGKVVSGSDLSKIEGELLKMTAERDVLKATLEGQVVPMLEKISARIKNIEDQPMPLPFAGTLRAVNKGEDAGGKSSAETTVDELLKTPEGRNQLSLALIKLSQQNPQSMTLAR